MTGMGAALLALASAVPIALPAQPTVQYRFKPGDTLIALSAKWLVRADSWTAVQRLNKIADPLRLPVGKPVAIPRALLKSEPVGAKVVAFRGAVSLAGKPPVLGAAVR